METKIQKEIWPQLYPLPEGGEEIDFRYEDRDTVAREERDFDWRALRWTEVLDFFEPVKGKILDVGAGFGDFLALAKGRGWGVEGLEISPTAITYARKTFGLLLSTPEEHEFEEGENDAVSCAYTLEHLGQPRAMVRDIFKSLRQGGRAYFCVPNDFSDFQKATGKEEWWVAPQHVNYFSFEDLEYLVEGEGFKVQGRTTSFPMEMFLLMGEDYTKRKSVGRSCHWRRRSFDEALPDLVRRRFYRTLANGGFGRTAELFCEKP